MHFWQFLLGDWEELINKAYFQTTSAFDEVIGGLGSFNDHFFLD